MGGRGDGGGINVIKAREWLTFCPLDGAIVAVLGMITWVQCVARW
jgi:hypothetical protein